MADLLRIFAAILVIIYFVVIFGLLKKRKLALRYSLLWLFSGIVMLMIIIWPQILVFGAKFLGIEVASNGLFATCILLEILIMISLTVVISDFANKIKSIIQNLALIEKRVRDIESELHKSHNDNKDGR